MFEATACCRMVLAATASVSVHTLRDLTRLMSAVQSPHEVGVLQGKHPTLPDSGGAPILASRRGFWEQPATA